MTARPAGFSVTNGFVHGANEVNSEEAVPRTGPGALTAPGRREEQ